MLATYSGESGRNLPVGTKFQPPKQKRGGFVRSGMLQAGSADRLFAIWRPPTNRAGKLQPFTLNGADVANSSILRDVVRQVAYRNEIILLCGDGQASGSPNALNTALQFYAMRLRHVLFVSDTAESCRRLRSGLPSLACVWSSRVPRTKPENGGGCVRRFWDMRFYFYDVRKHMVSQLAGELGVNVLQTDTDVAWFSNPYGALKSGESGKANILAQWDAPFVNAGVFYAQGLQPGDAATWVLRELHRRIALFMYNPDAVKRYVPWAKKPYFANADEQTLMNDVLISAMTNTSCYIWSTAFFESRYGGAGRAKDWQGWASTREGKLQPQLMRQCQRSIQRGTYLYSLSEPTGGKSSTFKRAPSSLFSHYLYLLKQVTPLPLAKRSGKSVTSVIDLNEYAASAAREDAPLSYRTHTSMPAVMVHLAGIRTGAWSRRAILRGHGWWHPEADALISAENGWNRRQGGALRVGGHGVIKPESRSQLDTFNGNLMLLALLLDRLAILPETPCSFEPTPRSCLDGCAFDSAQTQPRVTGSMRTSMRCASIMPKRCWRAEWSTQLEYERAKLRTAAARKERRRRSRMMRRLAEVEAPEIDNDKIDIPESELPVPPIWPQTEQWREVREQFAAHTANLGHPMGRGGKYTPSSKTTKKAAKISGSKKTGSGKKAGIPKSMSFATDAAAAAVDAESAAAASVAVGGKNGGERRRKSSDKLPEQTPSKPCRGDGDWLVRVTIGSWNNATRANTTAAQRRSLSRMLRSLACAPDGGVAELWRRGSESCNGVLPCTTSSSGGGSENGGGTSSSRRLSAAVAASGGGGGGGSNGNNGPGPTPAAIHLRCTYR